MPTSDIVFDMDIDTIPPQSASHPLVTSTLPSNDLPPSPPDTVSDIRKTMMDGDNRARPDTPGMDIDIQAQDHLDSHVETPIPTSSEGVNEVGSEGQISNSTSAAAVTTPQPAKINLKLRHPTVFNSDLTGGESNGPSRASTPGSGTGGKRRKGYVHIHT